MSDRYAAVVVGTGFASSFFLLEYLRHAGPNDRVLVLERGSRNAELTGADGAGAGELFVNRTPQKAWAQVIGFGGGTLWSGNTPRFLPSDFRTRSAYGVGEDWPLSYDDLEPYYAQVEDVMGVAGAANAMFPRSRPYPSPPHPMNAFDRLLERKYPGLHMPFPSARSSSLSTGRPVCCSNGTCGTCPISSKFQIDLHMADLFDDPRVTLLLEAEVTHVEIEGSRATGLVYRRGGGDVTVAADLVIVGANAIMTPFILLKSGLRDPALGRYLSEQVGCGVDLYLDGVDNYDGGQAVSGMGLMFLEGEFRKTRPGCLIENWNVPLLRAERGRWRQRAHITYVFEDVPDVRNAVEIATEDPSRPAVTYAAHSDYMRAGLDAVTRLTEELVDGLPVESFRVLPPEDLGGRWHIQGTTRMGTDPADSVVDADLRHHRVRNLVVLGAGVFPNCPAGNPTLTLSALAVRAADRLFAGVAG